MKQIVFRAVGVAECEQLPMGDVQLARPGMHGAQHSLEHVSLALLAAPGRGRPAVFTDPDRHVRSDIGTRYMSSPAYSTVPASRLPASSATYPDVFGPRFELEQLDAVVDLLLRSFREQALCASAPTVERAPIQGTYIRTSKGGPSPCKRSTASAILAKSSGGRDATPSGPPASPSGNSPKRSAPGTVTTDHDQPRDRVRGSIGRPGG